MFDYDPNKWGDMSSDENPEDDLENNVEDKINKDPFYVSLTETYVDIPQKKGTFREPDTWRRGMPYSKDGEKKKKNKKPRKSKSTGELVKLKKKGNPKVNKNVSNKNETKKEDVTNACVSNNIIKANSWVDIVKHTS